MEWTPSTIRGRRAELGLSQVQLATLLGEDLGLDRPISLRAVSNWENGNAMPHGRNLAALNRVLGAPAPTAEPQPAPASTEAAPGPVDLTALVGELQCALDRASADQVELPATLVATVVHILTSITRHPEESTTTADAEDPRLSQSHFSELLGEVARRYARATRDPGPQPRQVPTLPADTYVWRTEDMPAAPDAENTLREGQGRPGEADSQPL